MSLAQLRTFVTIVDEGTVTRAAKVLRIAQPPLSRRLRELEDELGVRLFARTPSGMTLLAPGHALLPRARRILADVDDAVRAVRRRED